MSQSRPPVSENVKALMKDQSPDLKSFLYDVLRADALGLSEAVIALFKALEGAVLSYEPMEVDTAWSALNDAKLAARQCVERDREFSSARQRIQAAFEPIHKSLVDMDADLAICAGMHDLEMALTFGGCNKLPFVNIVLAGDAQNFESTITARSLQRELRERIVVEDDISALDGAYALILGEEILPSHWMMAGAARARGIKTIRVGPAVPGHLWIQPVKNLIDLAAILREARAGIVTPEAKPLVDFIAGGAGAAPDATAGLRADFLARDLERLRDAAAFIYLSQSAKLEAIREMLAGSEFERPFSEIVANGSRTGETPIFAQLVNTLRHRIEALEAELAERKTNDESTTMEPH